MLNELYLSKYKTNFILGNNDEEKFSSREVTVNVWIRFPTEISACENDNLKDTICYETLIKFLDTKLSDSRFNLIEKATKYIYDLITEFIKNEKVLKKVELIKEKPIDKLELASFICSDW